MGQLAPAVTSPDARPPSQSRPLASVVHEISGWRRVIVWPAALLLKCWGRTLRFETSSEDLRHVTKRDVPVAFVVWHNRLFLTPEIFRRYRRGRPLVALISASGDGAWLSAFFSHVGMRAARGSSSRLGREAATALVDAQRAGHDIGITPDGPRGPCYEMKPGVVIVPRRTGSPLLLIGGEFSAAWRLRSWDRFYLPKPFSRVRLHCELVESAELADRDQAISRLAERMRAINRDDARPTAA